MAKIKKNKNKNKKNTTTSSPPNEETLISICKKATDFLDKKKEDNANSEMEKIKHQYKSFAFFHHVNSAVKSALHFKSPNNNFLFQESLVSAYTATILSPTSIDYSANYVRILLSYSKNYKQATRECIRALSLNNPTVTFGSVSSVTFYQEQLQNFLNKCTNNIHHQINKQLRFEDKDLFNSSNTEFVEVREICSRALCFINRKEYQKAERFMLEESHDFHCCFAVFHATFALVKYHNQHLRHAIFIARLSTLLSPNNIQYSLFYIELLIFYFSRYNFEAAAKECKRALAVNEPVDSFIDRFGESEAIDTIRIASYKRKIEYILQKITSPHCIKIASFKEYCSSFQNKLLDNLLTNALSLSSPWKLWFCPKCVTVEFTDSAYLMTHISNEHEHDYKFLDANNSILPKKVDGVWKQNIENNDLKPVQDLLQHNYLSESHFQYIWKYVFEEDGDYELKNFLEKIGTVSTEKLRKFYARLIEVELYKKNLHYESSESCIDDDATHNIEIDSSMARFILDQNEFPYKHNPSTVDNFNGELKEEDKVTLMEKILSEWGSYKSCRESEGNKIVEVIKENSLCLIEACNYKQDITSTYRKSLETWGDLDEHFAIEVCECIENMCGDVYTSDANLCFLFEKLQLCEVDSRILKILSRIEELKKKAAEICVLDY